MISFVKKMGPGLIFAGAAIGVSHLVQSTRAGADFGFGLVWALLLINAIKYPFIRFAPYYTTLTGENLIDGYARLGKWVLNLYFVMTFVTMFTIQAAVTIVTAGLASYLFGITNSVLAWSIIIIAMSAVILYFGRYSILDNLMKIIVLILTISTLVAVIAGVYSNNQEISWQQTIPHGGLEITFFIAFLGWMPTPLDVSVWQSVWTQEKIKQVGKVFDTKQSILDFNIGYIGTVFTGLLFIFLGAFAYYGSEVILSPNAGEFANQLISVYKENLGSWIGLAVGIAAFTTMFSTTLTTLDASPRVMTKTIEKFTGKSHKNQYLLWLVLLSIGTIIILAFFTKNMKTMVSIATIISFLTAPFYAIANLRLVTSKHIPQDKRPSFLMRVWSVFSILILIAFSVWYLVNLF